MTDKLTRFLFDDHSVRGELIQLRDTFKHALEHNTYPVEVSELLGEMLAACSILTATLKFEGEISLQVQSEGFVKYAVVHATHKQTLKSVARFDEEVDFEFSGFPSLFKKGYLVITITPSEGERYQGIVALDKGSLAECIEAYFGQSEQLPTKLRLFAKVDENAMDTCCGGIFLQVIPTSSETSLGQDLESMTHLSVLADTATADELFRLQESEFLFRLFHQENVRLLDSSKVEYLCDCSRLRTAQALKNVERSQIEEILQEDGVIKMNCHFCGAEYAFDAVDIENIQKGNLAFFSSEVDSRH